MRLLISFLILIIICSCKSNSHFNSASVHKKNFNEFNKYLFSLNKINSASIFDTLQKISDTVLLNASVDSVSKKGTVFINDSSDSKYLIYKSTDETIDAIIYYKRGNRNNVAEYYPNGQVICRFSVTEDGIRNGKYYCFDDKGNITFQGFYINGKDIADSARSFEKN